jgi:hypothetical protein
MAEARLIPFDDEIVMFRYVRDSWHVAGVDNFTQPPTQNPDLFEILTNVMPPVTGVFLRRWGYRELGPKLDAGASITDDET